MHRALVPQSIAAVLLLLSPLRPRGRKKEIKLPLCFSLSVARIEKEKEKKQQKTSLVGLRPSPSAALIGVAACRAQTLIPRARLEASLGQLSLSTDKQVTVTEATLPRCVSRLDG